jgi:hypothetical protein
MTEGSPKPLVSPRVDPVALLQEVRLAAERFDHARTALEYAIREARERNTLREVAAAAGISHESVRRIAGRRLTSSGQLLRGRLPVLRNVRDCFLDVHEPCCVAGPHMELLVVAVLEEHRPGVGRTRRRSSSRAPPRGAKLVCSENPTRRPNRPPSLPRQPSTRHRAQRDAGEFVATRPREAPQGVLDICLDRGSIGLGESPQR